MQPGCHTLSHRLGSLKQDALAEVFLQWMQVALLNLAGERLGLDGKTLAESGWAIGLPPGSNGCLMDCLDPYDVPSVQNRYSVHPCPQRLDQSTADQPVDIASWPDADAHHNPVELPEITPSTP